MFCVIVGEIVDASTLAPDIRKKVATAIQSSFDRINTDYMGSLVATFGMTRGDTFEGAFLAQYHAPQIIQDIIKAAYNVGKTIVRISVAIGNLTVTSDDRSTADGPAYSTAYANLEELKKRESTHWLTVALDVGPLGQALVDSQLGLLSALTEGWTEKQREIVWLVERHGGRQKIVSKKLGIPASVVSKQLRAASYTAYCQAWAGLKEFLIKLDEYTIADKPVIEKTYVPFFNMGLYELETKKDFGAALSHFHKALELAMDMLGKKDPLLIPIFNKLARTSLFMEEYDNAAAFIKESLGLQEKMPKRRLQHGETLLIKADISIDTKDYSAARKLLQQALDIALDILGDSHPFVGEIYSSYAFMYQTTGDSEKALAHFEMIQAIKSKYINEISPVDYATTLYNIAVCHYYARNYTEAVNYAEEALTLFEENLNPSHAHVGATKFLLSQLNN